MHLWSAASQQVNKGRVERHDGVAHVNNLSLLLARPETHKHKKPSDHRVTSSPQGNLRGRWAPEEQRMGNCVSIYNNVLSYYMIYEQATVLYILILNHFPLPLLTPCNYILLH